MGTGPVVVIVEDILSAVRVYEAGFRACAVLGTAFPAPALTEALRGCNQVISWLDPDAAGLAAHKKLRRALGLYDVTLRRVRSEHDPKMHSRLEIQEYIRRAV